MSVDSHTTYHPTDPTDRVIKAAMILKSNEVSFILVPDVVSKFMYIKYYHLGSAPVTATQTVVIFTYV